MSVALGIAALVVSVIALGYARRSARAATNSAGASTRSADAAERSAIEAQRSSDMAEAADRRARTPKLDIQRTGPQGADLSDRVIYQVRNDGPQDLDSLIIYRPRVPAGPRIPDGIKYPLSVTGGGVAWSDDEIELGPLPLTQVTSFTLCCSSEMKLPDFRVKIECRAGADRWEMTTLLSKPR